MHWPLHFVLASVGALAAASAAAAAEPSLPTQAAASGDRFLIRGTLTSPGGAPVKGKRVRALQVDAVGDMLRSFDVAKGGAAVAAGPSAVTDADGAFAISIARDYAIPGQKGLRLVALCIDLGRVEPGPHLVLVNITDDVAGVDSAKLVWSRSGTALQNAASLGAGVRFKLNGRSVTTEKVGDTVGLTLEKPLQLKVKGAAVEVSSLVAEADGFLAWNRVTTSTKGGTAVQWEAILENGWVDGYRILNADLTALQGQELPLPTAAERALPGKVEGNRIVITK